MNLSQLERVNSKKEIAERCGQSLRTIDRLIAEKSIAVIQLSDRRIGILESDFLEYLKSRRRPAIGDLPPQPVKRGRGRPRKEVTQ